MNLRRHDKYIYEKQNIKSTPAPRKRLIKIREKNTRPDKKNYYKNVVLISVTEHKMARTKKKYKIKNKYSKKAAKDVNNSKPRPLTLLL